MKHLRIPPLMATAAVALSLVLGGCGGSSSKAPEPPPVELEPMPVDVTMDLDLSETAQERLKGITGMADAGASDTISISAGGSVTVAGTPGVTFTCQSMYPCTVTVTNSLGNITATSMTKKMEADADPMVTASAPIPRMAGDVAGADRVNAAALHNLIRGDADSNNVVETNVQFKAPVAAGTALTNEERNAAAGTIEGDSVVESSGTSPATSPDVEQAMVKKLVRSGETATFELKGDLVEPVADSTKEPMIKSDATVSDSMPADTTPAGMQLVLPDAGADGLSTDLTGWRLHQLVRDWSHRLPDEPEDAPLYGGFHTNALVFENIDTDKERAFDKLFTLSTGDNAGRLENVSGDPMSNLANDHSLAMFEYDGPTGTKQDKKDQNEQFRGTFAGVAGNYQCTAADGGCWLTVDKKGVVSVVDNAQSAPGTVHSTLAFTPDDPKAMASVPDWTYMTFGAWMTTPAAMTGLHSFGLVDQTGGLASSLADSDTAGSYNINALTGTATYKGAAAGYYAKTGANAAAGAFTASAELTADFGAAAGEADNKLSGQVSNFHDANGKAMDEMVVDLDAAGDSNVNGTGAATGSTSGHANGVAWTGNWRAQLTGAADAKVTGLTLPALGTVQATIEAAKASEYPTGVVGAFDASNTAIAVTGAFGANLQAPADE